MHIYICPGDRIRTLTDWGASKREGVTCLTTTTCYVRTCGGPGSAPSPLPSVNASWELLGWSRGCSEGCRVDSYLKEGCRNGRRQRRVAWSGQLLPLGPPLLSRGPPSSTPTGSSSCDWGCRKPPREQGRGGTDQVGAQPIIRLLQHVQLPPRYDHRFVLQPPAL